MRMAAPLPAHVFALLNVLLSCAGCATTVRQAPLSSALDAHDVYQVIRTQDAQDARYQPLLDRPFLQVDLALRYRFEDYPRQADEATRRAFVAEILRAAGEIADKSVALSIAKLSDAALKEITREVSESRAAVAARVIDAQHQRQREELARSADLRGAALDRYWHEFIVHIDESIMTRGRMARRLMTAPAVPFIAGWIAYHNWHDDRGPRKLDFRHSNLLRVGAAPRPSGVNAQDWRLLQRYAPLVSQEITEGAAYSAADDRIGTVRLTRGEDRAPLPQVDSAQPALYAFVRRVRMQGSEVRQLSYTLWYPRHPKLSRFDPEAGPLDGWTVRLTLDAQGVPQLVESVSNCGCYYKIFPNDQLEQRAAAEFPLMLPDKHFHLEQHQVTRFDAVVPETITNLTPDTRLIVYFSAGHHQLITVRAAANSTVAATAEPYQLRAYEELETLPLDGHAVGLFGSDGLVRSAHRPECTLLSPSGVYHAGHPRQRETQMIYFDEADFDSPRLLEEYLRLPSQAFGTRS